MWLNELPSWCCCWLENNSKERASYVVVIVRGELPKLQLKVNGSDLGRAEQMWSALRMIIFSERRMASDDDEAAVFLMVEKS